MLVALVQLILRGLGFLKEGDDFTIFLQFNRFHFKGLPVLKWHLKNPKLKVNTHSYSNFFAKEYCLDIPRKMIPTNQPLLEQYKNQGQEFGKEFKYSDDIVLETEEERKMRTQE